MKVSKTNKILKERAQGKIDPSKKLNETGYTPQYDAILD